MNKGMVSVVFFFCGIQIMKKLLLHIRVCELLKSNITLN